MVVTLHSNTDTAFSIAGQGAEIPHASCPKTQSRKKKKNTGAILQYGLPCGSVGKESGCSAGDMGSIPGFGKIPGEGNGNPLHYSCLENSHEQRSLVGYSSWGHKIQTQFRDQTTATSFVTNSIKTLKMVCIEKKS